MKSPINFTGNKKLSRNFYTRNVIAVAKELLGKVLVKRHKNKLLAGIIAEVEAYDGSVDEAAHTFNGITKRNEVMFNEGGYFYVYFTYGNHFCCNIVTGKKGKGTAVLIRAVEPVEGIETMVFNRYRKRNISEKEKLNITSGPGKLCKAFGINRKHSGLDLTGNEIYLLENEKIKNRDVVITKRIGISKSVDLPWRFYIKDNPYVSRK